MSSNIKVRRICHQCNREFIARTTVTKYCSEKCNRKHYKELKRAQKIEKSNNETQQIRNKPISELKEKEYLNISEVCMLIGISRRTVYRLIKNGNLIKIKIGTRTIIKRTTLNKFLDASISQRTEIIQNKKPELNNYNNAVPFEIEDCYTLTEIKNKFKISEGTVKQIIKRNNIPKMKKGKYAFVPKHFIDKIMS